jgi:hypothetical protein
MIEKLTEAQIMDQAKFQVVTSTEATIINPKDSGFILCILDAKGNIIAEMQPGSWLRSIRGPSRFDLPIAWLEIPLD